MRFLMESSDGWVFSMETAVARQSTFINHLLTSNGKEDEGMTEKVMLSLIDGDVLAQIVSYLEARHRGFGPYFRSRGIYEIIFLDENKDRLAELLVAVDFLDIPDLFSLICRGICDVIKQTCDESKKAVLIGKVLNLSHTVSIVDIWAKAGSN